MNEHYELMFIAPGSADEAKIPALQEKILALLAKFSAKITNSGELTRKKLSYEIKHETHGYYEVLEFDLAKNQLPELNRQLLLMPEILRFILIKATVKTKEELAEEENIRAKIREKQAESVKNELKAAEEQAEQEKKVDIKKEEDRTEGKLSMADLDKKLNEILSDDLKV